MNEFVISASLEFMGAFASIALVMLANSLLAAG
jgi:hypothetical protein